jgi:hypothetical protein
MRLAIWLVTLAICVPMIVGCSGGGGDTDPAADKAFQDSLSKAAKDGKGGTGPKRTMGKPPAPGTAATATGSGPKAGLNPAATTGN